MEPEEAKKEAGETDPETEKAVEDLAMTEDLRGLEEGAAEAEGWASGPQLAR